jgi:uncharacterized membrane protein
VALGAARLWVGLLVAVLVAAGFLIGLRPGARPVERFAGWLVALGAACTLFVEYVVLQGDIGRMNTVFKFYIQVWTLWSVVAAVGFAWLVPHLARVSWGRAWKAAFAALVAAGLLYPATATRAKIADRFPAAPGMPAEVREGYESNWGPGLSGIGYEEYAYYDDDGSVLRLAADREAIFWLLENVEGTPVVLEGFREKAYRWGSRYSIHTGLPAVVGWDWHQKQQRNAVGHGVVDERTAAVRTLYSTTDSAETRRLLDLYAVEYVVVGEMEKAFYPAEGVAKFAAMADRGEAELAFRSSDGAVEIYRILRSDGDGVAAVPGMSALPEVPAP